MKTSPSGGARNPIEAYVLAWNVEGLQAGAYHYDSDTSELVDLGRKVSANDIPGLLAHQSYFAGAGAAVVMCPVFARSMWKYGHSRAYRMVLIDAGHLGQTFCLVATALGLAPFTTMAFSESALEELLGLDGVRECPIYVAGVGCRCGPRKPGRAVVANPRLEFTRAARQASTGVKPKRRAFRNVRMNEKNLRNTGFQAELYDFATAKATARRRFAHFARKWMQSELRAKSYKVRLWHE